MGKPGYGKDTPGSFLHWLLTVLRAGKGLVGWRGQHSAWVWVHQNGTVAVRRSSLPHEDTAKGWGVGDPAQGARGVK